MTDIDMPAGVSRWEPLGFLDLFRWGPWEIVVVLWVLGGAAVYSLLARPMPRILSVTDPALAGLAGGMLATFLAAQAGRRRYSSSRSLTYKLYVAGSFSLGAAALSFCTNGPFHPVVSQASSCAPRIALSQSDAGYWAAWLLPAVLWLSWCGYILSSFPAVRRFAHINPHSRESRYRDYERALWSLPFRTLLLVAVVGAVWASTFYKYTGIQPDSSVEEIIEALGQLPPEALSRTGGPEASLGRVEEIRLRAESEALGALDAMELDRARPLVKRAACNLLLPTSRPSKDILSAEANFSALDQEIDAMAATEEWRPSSSSVAAIVHLAPINPSGSTKPICPLFWPSRNDARPRYVSQRDISTSTRSIEYKGRQLLDIRLASVPLEDDQPATLEVAIKVNGTTGDSGNLAALLESRLGQKPTEGPRSIGRGAVCAHWLLGPAGIRLGPAVGPQIPESSMTPESPLWITCYDRSLKGALDLIYQSFDGRPSWDPHSCNVITPILLNIPTE